MQIKYLAYIKLFDHVDEFLVLYPSIHSEIQESEKGHLHIPVSEEGLLEEDRTWLCVTRRNSQAQ